MSFVSGIHTGNSYWEGEAFVFPFKHKGRRRKLKRRAYGIFTRSKSLFKAHA